MPEGKQPDRARKCRLWVCAAALLLLALTIPSVQFAHQTVEASARGKHKGAIARWLKAAGPLWEGKNIYRARPADPNSETPPSQGVSDDTEEGSDNDVWLHPNMPLVLILLSPLAHLPPLAGAILVNVAKILLVFAAVWMLREVVAGRSGGPATWVLFLGVLWAILQIVGDIQHGNTNIFVLAAIILHLWLYRRGHDGSAGASLALAICLKMTPALFVLYWLYQRNWKLLGGVVVGLALLAIVIPAATLGPTHASELTHNWLDNLIVPGLVKNSSYPIHINQSLPAMMDRFFMPEGSPGGNIWWNPDDLPDYAKLPPDQRQWITLCSLSPGAVQALTRLAQFTIVCLMAWAIGWRRLPRDDPRRALHYGMIVLGMTLLNQRTWDHHAAVLLVTTVPLWLAIGFGRVSARARKAALALTIAGGIIYWLTRQEMLRAMAHLAGFSKDHAKTWADIAEAYGGSFYFFVLLLAATAIMAISLKNTTEPLSQERQRL